MYDILSSADFPDYSSFLDYYKTELLREPPQGLQLWFQYAKEQRCTLSQVYYSRIERELARFRFSGISPDDVQVARSLPNIWAFSFQAGKVTAVGGGMPEYGSLFQPIAVLIPNITIVVNALDEPRIPFSNIHNLSGPFSVPYGEDVRGILNGSCNTDFWSKSNDSHGFFTSTISFNVFIPEHRPIPIFSQCTLDECFMDITLPSYHFLDFAYRADQDWKPWREKHKTDLFWRGAGSGTCATVTGNWRGTQRFRLIHQARQQSEYDVKMTDNGPCFPTSICDEEFNEYVTPDKLPYRRHFDYKYLLDIDGNSFSRSLLPKLRSNSLVLRVFTFDVFFDDFIISEEHYISTKLDDLPLKYKEMKIPDSGAEEIAFEAFRTATRYLRIEDMRCYMARLLIEYEALLLK